MTFGPQSADQLYYRLAEVSVRTSEPGELARSVSQTLGEIDSESARFWLGQPIFVDLDRSRAQTPGQRDDVARLEAVDEVLRRFSGQ
jgi:hypothetical protein